MSEDKKLSHIGTLAIDRAWQAVLECFRNRDYEGSLDAQVVMAYTASDDEIINEIEKMISSLYQKINVETTEGMSRAETSLANIDMRRDYLKRGSFKIYHNLVSNLKKKHYLDYEGIKPRIPGEGKL